ncbi:ABC transporter substrate-binding protein [Streptomyces sp. SID13031]|uniref:ABC transporter substrate-binding protein n=1 Tax=Streptomyces sp. SID13031 TaxID=2706046 RepID=UPI0013CB8D41|nr:ABC transporter substrate-binding protein [Streptomyces sp. SID13031]NEA32948.1 ABC transporter substrate-binding protein [Streptomyces sp. SID13031]
MRFRRPAVALVAVLALTTGMSACNDDSKTGTNGDVKLEKVSYLTSFGTFGREAYAYVALEKGYFKDAGLDVKITPGKGTVDVMKIVAGGQADYGIGDFTALMITLANQKLPVTTVGMIQQRSMAAIVALDGGQIKNGDPKSLVKANGEKTRIGDQPGSTNWVTFPLYAQQVGIDPKSVEFVPSPPPGLPKLLAADKVDGIGQFVVGVPLVEAADKEKKRKAVVLPYGEKVQDLYGNAIIARDDLVKDHSAQVQKFTTALLKGMDDALADPAAAAQILKKYVPDTNVEVATKELELMKPYVKPDGYAGMPGGVETDRVNRIITDLVKYKVIPKGSITPADVVNTDLAPKG